MNTCSVAVLTIFSTALAAPRPDDPPAKGPAELQGVWKLTAIEVKGKSRDPLGGGGPRWVIAGNTISYGGAELARLTADPSTAPRVIDLAFREPKREYEGIYAVEKETLKVCLNRRDGAKDRPGQFTTKDQPDWLLLVFEKEKAPPAKATDGLTGFAGIAIRMGENKEVLVDAPIKGSPAEKADLKKGDRIRKVGAIDATDLQTTVNAVRGIKPGARLDVHITRDGKQKTITVTVGVLPFRYVVGLE